MESSEEVTLIKKENRLLRGENMKRTNEIKSPEVSQRSKTEELKTIIEKCRQELKKAKKESADKIKQISKLKQDLLTTSDYQKKKSCEEEHNNDTTSRVKYQENTEIRNLTTDLYDFKRFVTNEIPSLRDYLEAEKYIMNNRNNTKVPRKEMSST